MKRKAKHGRTIGMNYYELEQAYYRERARADGWAQATTAAVLAATETHVREAAALHALLEVERASVRRLEKECAAWVAMTTATPGYALDLAVRATVRHAALARKRSRMKKPAGSHCASPAGHSTPGLQNLRPGTCEVKGQSSQVPGLWPTSGAVAAGGGRTCITNPAALGVSPNSDLAHGGYLAATED